VNKPSSDDPINVDYWVLPLDWAPREFAWLAGLCTQKERNRLSRSVSALDGKRRVVARGLLRLVLASYVNVAPELLEFARNPFGKPALVTLHEPCGFNLSHSEGWAVIAVCSDVAVGIDIEVVRPIEADITGTTLTAREHSRLMDLSSDLRQASFYRAWTRKEAVLKAIGVALHRPLQSLEVSSTLNLMLDVSGRSRCGILAVMSS
jgi:4'-phosphopantetheinyl transferase